MTRFLFWCAAPRRFEQKRSWLILVLVRRRLAMDLVRRSLLVASSCHSSSFSSAMAAPLQAVLIERLSVWRSAALSKSSWKYGRLRTINRPFFKHFLHFVPFLPPIIYGSGEALFLCFSVLARVRCGGLLQAVVVFIPADTTPF